MSGVYHQLDARASAFGQAIAHAGTLPLRSPEADPTGRAANEQRSALDRQEGGSHYKNMKVQPFEYIHANGIGYAEGAAIKYLSRWRSKGGIEDLKKARHFIDLLIEAETTAKPAG